MLSLIKNNQPQVVAGKMAEGAELRKYRSNFSHERRRDTTLKHLRWVLVCVLHWFASGAIQYTMPRRDVFVRCCSYNIPHEC